MFSLLLLGPQGVAKLGGGGLKRIMPKIDTLDALDDRMTSMLKTL